VLMLAVEKPRSGLRATSASARRRFALEVARRRDRGDCRRQRCGQDHAHSQPSPECSVPLRGPHHAARQDQSRACRPIRCATSASARFAEGRQVVSEPDVCCRPLEMGAMLPARRKHEQARNLERIFPRCFHGSPRGKRRRRVRCLAASSHMLAIGRCLMGKPDLVMFRQSRPLGPCSHHRAGHAADHPRPQPRWD